MFASVDHRMIVFPFACSLGPASHSGVGRADTGGDGDEFRERPLRKGHCKFILGRKEAAVETDGGMEAFRGEKCFGVNEMPLPSGSLPSYSTTSNLQIPVSAG